MLKYLVIVAIVAILILAPLLIIWSMNTLFPVLAIPYSINTWAAATILGGLLSAKIK